MTPNNEKTDFRSRVLADLMGMDKTARKKASGMIEDRLKQLLGEAQCVMAFWPLPSEPDITVILRGLHNDGTTICLPGTTGGRITPYRVEDFSTLKPSSVGVNEPDTTSSEEFAANKIDLVIVPGLAFDQSGHRIGYGSGYYDRFLPELPSESVGLCFSENFFDILPRAAHDAHVKYVITESILHNVVS